MKKIYMLTASLFLAGAVSAQTQIVTDGGFEGTYYPGTAFGQTSPNVGGYTAAPPAIQWIGIVANETVAPITGTHSAVMTSVDDAAAAAWVGSTPSQVGGFIQQVYKGAALVGKTPAQISLTYKFKFEPVGVDTAFVMVNILDSTKVGNAQLMYQGLGLMIGSTPTATLKTITTWANGPSATTGTANRVTFLACSSISNWFDDVPANVGSKFTLDDLSMTVATAGVSEIAASSSIYPNPVQDVLNVEISNAEATSISIYTLSGALVQTTALNGVKGSVNVEALQTGMYLYTISTKGGATIQSKFLKK